MILHQMVIRIFYKTYRLIVLLVVQYRQKEKREAARKGKEVNQSVKVSAWKERPQSHHSHAN